MRDSYAALLAHTRETALLQSTAAILSWDQETMMPPGGVAHRARQLAQLARLAHEQSVDPRVAGWLADCEGDAALRADAGAQATLRELRRRHARAIALPAPLIAELAETQSLAQHAWARARERNEFAAFQPWLEKLVGLQQRKAECLGRPAGGESWDALADEFEPGLRTRDVEALLTPLAADLRVLLEELRGGEAPDDRAQRRVLPIAQQEAFVRHVIERMGFDFARGRLDRSTHPFCGGSHCDDVRMTTRFRDDELLDALGSTMHEAGHGLYEQGLPAAQLGTPLGEAVSLGIHESQSRLWENQVGRSRAFWRWCQPLLGRFFGDALADLSAEDLFRCANRVQPDLIRVEADEATYNLHVLVRFEIERALIRGELRVAELPAAWNAGYRAHLGVEVPDDRRGCLQDVHWSCGLFGYFPTYTLGNVYAAQLFDAARRALGDLDAQIARGEFAPLKAWLNTHVHAHGQRYLPRELCERATGAPPSPAHLLRYLRDKLHEVYGL
jgi:carboxypeptidase Taq